MFMIKDSLTEQCPLCHQNSKRFYLDIFYCCNECEGIFKRRQSLPTPQEEIKRYEEHNNDVNDIRYQNFVSPITNAVKSNFSTEHLGLDFGSGTGPVISKVLSDYEYNIKQFDPFFCNDTDVLQLKYDYIVCCEVIEHFHFPDKEFHLLKHLLKPKGHLYCMTHLYSKEIYFANWYYKNDDTHVFIYQPRTLYKIKELYNFSALVIEKRLVTFIN